MSDLPREVFDTNFDYHFAAEQRRSGEKGIVQKLGERAVKWFRGMNEKRKAEKAERKYKGSFEEIVPFTETRSKEAQALPEPGVYRSNFSENQPEPALTQTETDHIMRQAVARARKNLGTLPVIAMQEAEKPTHSAEDAALLARLEKAFNNPLEPDRSDHVRREDDTLAGTQGK